MIAATILSVATSLGSRESHTHSISRHNNAGLDCCASFRFSEGRHIVSRDTTTLVLIAAVFFRFPEGSTTERSNQPRLTRVAHTPPPTPTISRHSTGVMTAVFVFLRAARPGLGHSSRVTPCHFFENRGPLYAERKKWKLRGIGMMTVSERRDQPRVT